MYISQSYGFVCTQIGTQILSVLIILCFSFIGITSGELRDAATQARDIFLLYLLFSPLLFHNGILKDGPDFGRAKNSNKFV
jgi:hypothetical protein